MPPLLSPADRFELADLVARYAVAVDTREFSLLRSVFTADCTLDTGRAERHGIDDVLAAMEGLRRYEATSHVVGQHLAEATPAGATGLAYCTAHHLTRPRPDQRDHAATPTDKVMHIRYHDAYVHTDVGWRIATRRLVVAWTDESPVG